MSRPICTVFHEDRSVALAPGESITFGRVDSAPDRVSDPPESTEPHLAISASAQVHARCGRIAADDSGWTLENLGRWLHLRLAPIGRGDRVDVEPGRSLRVPWPEARVEVLTADELVAIDISCPILAEQPSVSPAAVGPAGATVGGLGLDRDAGYFLAAIALCEPRLRDPSTSEVASVAQVARTLSGVGPERVSVKAAERRLAHLRSRLGVGGDALGGSAAGLEVRDAGRQLVDLLLRTGTVTVADLARLEPRDHDTSDGPS